MSEKGPYLGGRQIAFLYLSFMKTAILKVQSGSLPAGTQIQILEEVSLGHYSSALGYFDLRLQSGQTLKMVHVYNDLDYPPVS